MNRLLLSIWVLLLCGVTASAHSPHNDVFDVRCSPGFPQDDRLYALERSNFLVSNDRGVTWGRKVNGLDHKHMLTSLDSADEGRTVYATSLGDGVLESPTNTCCVNRHTDICLGEARNPLLPHPAASQKACNATVCDRNFGGRDGICRSMEAANNHEMKTSDGRSLTAFSPR